MSARARVARRLLPVMPTELWWTGFVEDSSYISGPVEFPKIPPLQLSVLNTCMSPIPVNRVAGPQSCLLFVELRV